MEEEVGRGYYFYTTPTIYDTEYTWNIYGMEISGWYAELCYAEFVIILN